MRKVPYLQWEHILLDTSVIFLYLQAMRDNNTDKRAVFVKRLIDDLNNNKSTNNINRHFYISAISISEMYDKSTDIKKTDKIISKMNITDMTFFPFDTDVAEFMTSNYHAVLGTDKQKAILRELSWDGNDLTLAREWITKDLMILATADYLKCDTVLTMDENTFLPLANKVDYFCCVTKEENFNHNDTYIFEYN
jgi:hypothetical protein